MLQLILHILQCFIMKELMPKIYWRWIYILIMLINLCLCVYICYDEGMEVPNIIIDNSIGALKKMEKNDQITKTAFEWVLKIKKGRLEISKSYVVQYSLWMWIIMNLFQPQLGICCHLQWLWNFFISNLFMVSLIPVVFFFFLPIIYTIINSFYLVSYV